MTPIMTLEAIQAFLQEELEKAKYTLRAPPEYNQRGTGTQADQYRIPLVEIGNLPHINFSGTLPEAFWMAPYILVGLERASDEDKEANASVLLQVCCYSEVDYDDGRKGLRLPDSKAYMDALNLLQWIKTKLISKTVLGKDYHTTAVSKPFEMGMYSTKEMTYPYAFGYLSFAASIQQEEITFLESGDYFG